MKKRSAYLFCFILAGLWLTAQIALAQHPSDNELRNRTAEIKCQTPVTITGAVRAPSRVELRRRIRLIELLVAAGGMTEGAGKTVELTRADLGSNCERVAQDEPNKKLGKVEVYNLAELLRGDEKANPYVQPGDTVDVSEASVIYVVGNVAKPQMIILKGPITVTQAIAMAGGALSKSITERVRILRGQCDLVRETIVVNLKAIKKRRAEDVVLQPNDIVEVPRKGGHGGLVCQKLVPAAIELPLRIIY